jgi:HEPN domain-containing protein
MDLPDVAMHKPQEHLDTTPLISYSLADAAMQQSEVIHMAAATKHEATHAKESSTLALLSGWAQQGVQTLFATQRILLDLTMRQNASVMHAIRQQLSDTHHSPTAILSEIAEEGVTNFLEGQKVLLELGKQQNEILMTGVKERVGDCPRRHALIDLLRRSVETFIHMQEEYLKIAGKQTHTWVESAKSGKPYQPEHVVDLAREGLENFVKAQKRFLDVVAEETAKATSGKHNGAVKKMKKTELSELARKSTDSFLEAQKRLVDVAGQQVSANVKTASKAFELLKPFPFLPLSDLTREAVKSYVDAQKALMDVMVKPPHAAKPERRVRKAPKAKAAAAAAVA